MAFGNAKMRRKILPIFCVAIFGLFGFGQGQEDAMRYFNIATKKAVTVNATCGENIQKKETYCKLVGYDSQFMVQSSNQILQGQICDFCLSPETEDSEKAHPGSNAVDGDINTWWQSPPISRGLKYNRVTLAIGKYFSFSVLLIASILSFFTLSAFSSKILNSIHFFRLTTDFPSGLCYHDHGQFSQTRRLGLRKVQRRWPKLATLAIFCWK